MTRIDEILTEYQMANHTLVEAYAEMGKQLSHKTVQKARTGSRPLSRKLQVQVTEALNAAIQPEKKWHRDELFPQSPEAEPVETGDE